MKFKTSNTKFYSKEGKFYILMQVPDTSANEANKLCGEGLKDVEIKKHSEKRSLTANAYAHTLMEKIAKKLLTTHNEVYEQMLHDYGVKLYIVCTEKGVEDKRKDYKFVEVYSKVKIENEAGKIVDAVQVKCIRGSSKYNAKEFGFFLDGIITECRCLEIDVITPTELARLMEGYVENKR